MSGIGVMVKWGGRPDAAQVQALAESVTRRGPDGTNIVDCGECVLVHAQFASTPEALRESQPLRHIANDWWLVADARIDNRDELRAHLKGQVAHPLDTDADYLMAAYELWGVDLARHLRGDFAFAIWNGATHEVLLVRDHLGLRPMHWAMPAGDRFVASSTLRGALDAAELPLEPDLEYLAEFLSFRLQSQGHSPFEGVHRLIPAHSLQVQCGETPMAVRYWTPSVAKSDTGVPEAAAHLKVLFDDSVRERSRRIGRLGAHLSGGYDSSSVFMSAVRQAGPEEVVGFVLQFSGETCDETEYAAAVAATTTAHVEWFDALNCEPYDHKRRIAETLDLTMLPDNEYASALARRSRQLGCRVVLTGQGGDHTLHGSPAAAAIDLALSGRLVAAIRMQRPRSENWAMAVGATTRNTLRRTAYMALMRLAPATARRLAERIRGRRAGYGAEILGPQLLKLYRSAVAPPDVRRGRWGISTGQRASNFVGWDWFTWFAELWDQTALDGPVECRHPFLDVRIIEYVLSLGEDVLLAGGAVRGLHRLSMGAELPNLVRSRVDKAEFSRPWARSALRSFPLGLESSLCVSEQSWVDAGVLERELAGVRLWLQAPKTTPEPDNLVILWAGMLVGAWSEALEHSSGNLA